MGEQTPARSRRPSVESSAVVKAPAPPAPATEELVEVACGRNLPPFVIRLADPATIAQARRIISGAEQHRVLLQGTIVAIPAPYNGAWSFHLDPRSIRFVERTQPAGEVHARAIERRLARETDAEGRLGFLPENLWSPTLAMAKLTRAVVPEDIDEALGVAEVLAEELDYIRGYRGPQGRVVIDPPRAPTVAQAQQAIFDSGAAALCLSGGGIRSATFNLGALQGLAQKGVLERFDYISSVSGGGYIAGWLSAWAFRSGHLRHVLPVLAHDAAGVLHSAPDRRSPIEWLRDFSNYLSPKVGLFSVDTWTLVATYVRNLLVIWLAIIPPLMALLAMPRMVADFMNSVPGGQAWIPTAQVALLSMSGMLLLIYGETYSYKLTRSTGRMTAAQNYVLQVNLPFTVGVVLLSAAWIASPKLDFIELVPSGVPLVGGLRVHEGAIVPIAVALTVAAAALQACWYGEGDAAMASRWKSIGVIAAVAALAVTAFNIVLFFVTTLELTTPFVRWPASWQYVVFPAFFLYMLLLGDIVYIAFRSHATTDEDRERWARSAAWFAILALGWIAYAGIALLAPAVLWKDERPDWLAHALNGVGAVGTGLVLALVGRSPGTPASTAPGARDALKRAGLPAAMALFVVLVLSLLASLLHALERVLRDAEVIRIFLPIRLSADGQFTNVPSTTAFFVFVLLVVLCLAVLRWVNINNFSLHAMYRDRLMRAYLGAARTRYATAGDRFQSVPLEFRRFEHVPAYQERWRLQEQARSPNLYTGFDEADNPDFWWLGIHRTQPLWVVNMALNISAGNRHLSWQERKAATFTVSPLHCGSWLTGYRRTWTYGSPQGGISCGTAMAISGAATNPNMGYHSSPALTFLMTFFNVRLGWWLGNPTPPPGERIERFHREGGPRQGLWQLIRELVGKVDATSRWIHLSDGGHFDNLGLYEMVLRRCRYIVVCDASADPERTFADLGNALRKIRTDLGVSIEPKSGQEWQIGRRDRSLASGHACFDVKYGEDPSEWGNLLYVKPSVYDKDSRLPPDVRQYAHGTRFPHEPTTDQFFTESQFESYRALGEYQLASQVFEELDRDVVARDGFDAVFAEAERTAKLGVRLGSG